MSSDANVEPYRHSINRANSLFCFTKRGYCEAAAYLEATSFSNKLFTAMYPCQHAIQFGTSQWVVGQVTEGLASHWA